MSTLFFGYFYLDQNRKTIESHQFFQKETDNQFSNNFIISVLFGYSISTKIEKSENELYRSIKSETDNLFLDNLCHLLIIWLPYFGQNWKASSCHIMNDHIIFWLLYLNQKWSKDSSFDISFFKKRLIMFWQFSVFFGYSISTKIEKKAIRHVSVFSKRNW